MKFHHIGIACKDIEVTKIFLQKSFEIKNITDTLYDEKQDVNLCILTTSDNLNIELVSGITVKPFIKKSQFLYHNCWSVKNIDISIKLLVSNGATLISEPKEAILFNNNKVAFLFSDIGIVELLEEKND